MLVAKRAALRAAEEKAAARKKMHAKVASARARRSPACSRLPGTSFAQAASSMTGADCGQPRPMGSFKGPSSIMETKSNMMKLPSSVVTTSSTPNLTLR